MCAEFTQNPFVTPTRIIAKTVLPFYFISICHGLRITLRGYGRTVWKLAMKSHTGCIRLQQTRRPSLTRLYVVSTQIPWVFDSKQFRSFLVHLRNTRLHSRRGFDKIWFAPAKTVDNLCLSIQNNFRQNAPFFFFIFI